MDKRTPLILSLFRILQARLAGAEILLHIHAGQSQVMYGQVAPSKLKLINQTCELNRIQSGWIWVLSKQDRVKLRTFGEVQRIEQALMNVIYLA